ncbi:MAG: SIR2 family protein [Hyphomonas sp.]
MNGADIAEQFEKHLNSPKQTWLLGAGVSFAANIPLMYPLTTRVMRLARENYFAENATALEILKFLESDINEGSHIEEMLTHLGDCISIAERSRKGGIEINGALISKASLVGLHRKLLEIIAETVRWGFRPARIDDDGIEIEPERAGARGKSIVEIADHSKFISAVFGQNRAGVEYLRTPVEFFTTNYDTLLEDALALNRVAYLDGFTGGGIGFWNEESYTQERNARAVVTKLHGSTDWYRPDDIQSTILRVRDSDVYPNRSGGAVMIYPQATKYQNAQRDPFSELFQRFRHRLNVGVDHVLLICGYSFGDLHINDEIERAMASPKSQLTIIVFADEPNGHLPNTIRTWRSQMSWRKRVFVASPKGLYQGEEGPHFGTPGQLRDWWTFSGATKLFAQGLPGDVQGAIQ